MPTDHVLRQRLTQPVPQHIDVEWLLAGIERHQMLALIRPFSNHHRTVTNPRQDVLVCGGRDYGDREALTELATGSRAERGFSLVPVLRLSKSYGLTRAGPSWLAANVW